MQIQIPQLRQNQKGVAALKLLMVGVLMLAVTTILLAFTSYTVGQTKEQIGTDLGNTSYAYNNTAKGEQALGNIGNWLPLVAIVLAAVVILLLLIGGFSGVIGPVGGEGM